MDSSEQLGLVLARMHHGMVIYDADERICLINAQVGRIMGYNGGDIGIGSTLSDWLACVGKAGGWSLERTETVINNHRLWSKAGVPRKLDQHFGSEKIFEVTFDPLASGGAILTFVDVTYERSVKRTAADQVDRMQRANAMLPVIAKIASNTRMLAINAGIEAARIGDEGRAFAVIAEEIRGLSAQTSAALAEISEINQVTGAASLA